MPTDHQAVLNLEVPVIVQLGERSMSIAEVLNLVPGSIIELPKDAEAELELLINNKPVGTGSAVKVGENFGLRVSFVGDLRARLEASLTGCLEIGTEDAAGTDPTSGMSDEELAEALLAGQM
jgi:Flagellar motor switch/type III secretory pathway protein